MADTASASPNSNFDSLQVGSPEQGRLQGAVAAEEASAQVE